jgi:hypothetical protein
VFSQDRYRLPRQRNAVRPAHLHLFGWDGPNCTIKVEFGPFRLAQFPRSDKNIWCEAKRGVRCWLSVKTFDRQRNGVALALAVPIASRTLSTNVTAHSASLPKLAA